jgi:hypothetical protein
MTTPLSFSFDIFLLHLAAELVGVEVVQSRFILEDKSFKLYWKSPLLCDAAAVLASGGGGGGGGSSNDITSGANSQNQNSQNLAPLEQTSSPHTHEQSVPSSKEEVPIYWDITIEFDLNNSKLQLGVLYPSGYYQTVPWTNNVLQNHIGQMGLEVSTSLALAQAMAHGFISSSSCTAEAQCTTDNNNDASNATAINGVVITKSSVNSSASPVEASSTTTSLSFSWFYQQLESRGNVTLNVQKVANSLETGLMQCLLASDIYPNVVQSIAKNPNNHYKGISSSSSPKKDPPTHVDESLLEQWRKRVEKRLQLLQAAAKNGAAGQLSQKSSISPVKASTTKPRKYAPLPGAGRKNRRGSGQKILELGRQLNKKK